MAALVKFDSASQRALGAARVTTIFETKLFFIIRGRNAWHSTWVQHYFDSCMHDALASAKDRAEALRENGAVFTIREQPALALRSDRGTLLITEINTPVPLKHWCINHRGAKDGFALNQGICRLETLAAKNPTLGAVAAAMRDPEMFPRHLPALSRDLLVLAARDAGGVSEDRRTRLKRWRSSSMGADYYLNWAEHPSDLSGRAVRRVADALADRRNPPTVLAA